MGVDEAVGLVWARWGPDDAALVKGSRVVRLDDVVRALRGVRRDRSRHLRRIVLIRKNHIPDGNTHAVLNGGHDRQQTSRNRTGKKKHYPRSWPGPWLTKAGPWLESSRSPSPTFCSERVDEVAARSADGGSDSPTVRGWHSIPIWWESSNWPPPLGNWRSSFSRPTSTSTTPIWDVHPAPPAHRWAPLAP